jgi:hypothetical protein
MSSDVKNPAEKDGNYEQGEVSSPSCTISSRVVRGSSDVVDNVERKRKEASTDVSYNRKRKESRKSDRKSRKRHRKYRDEDSSASSSASTSSSLAVSTTSSSDDDSGDRRKKKKKKSRKRSHDHKKNKKNRSKDKGKKEKKSKERKRSNDDKDRDNEPVFGKYGIIKLSDMPIKQRSFEMWLEQVKKIPGFTGPKWELQNYFKEYAEDYNTATLPHIKYYDYDRWEMDEYKKEKTRMEISSSAASSKEALYQREQRDLTRNKQKEGLDLVRSTMNKEKIEEMKRQKQLQSEMAHAFKTGDHQRYQQLKNRLEREK